MSRCLLHITKLDEFKRWLSREGIEHRPPRGDYDVLQVRVKDGWQCIFSRHHMPEHYTVAAPLEPTVWRFIKARRAEENYATQYAQEQCITAASLAQMRD